MKFEKIDEYLLREGYKVSDLELAARECDKRAMNSRNIYSALIAQNCAISIRKLPAWQAYDICKSCTSSLK